MNEEWRDVVGYEGLYAVSSLGRVKRLADPDSAGCMRKERIRKPCPDKNTYFKVNLCKDGKVKVFFVHRLVAIAFIPTNDYSLQINHKNGNKQDNSVENLEWVTCKENVYHAHQMGLVHPAHNQRYGETNSHCKVTDEQVEEIRKDKTSTIAQLCEKYGIGKTQIRRICSGEQRKRGSIVIKDREGENGY